MTDPRTAIVSIHDVMPETLESVAAIRAECVAAGLGPPGLLVVPGRNWSREHRGTLHRWEQEGSELIAHGWLHETCPRRLYHRLHAAVLSRNAAEHLERDGDAVLELMARSRDWFIEEGLAAPQTYIPPAWALGVAPERLRELPYRRVEVLRGVYLVEPQEVRLMPLPLVGFEADTALRAATLRLWNRRALRRSEASGQPLRIAIHPRDRELLLGPDLRRLLLQGWHSRPYAGLSA